MGLLDVEIPMSLLVIATVAVVCLVVGVLVLRTLRARARARALEREIMKQSERQAASVRPERRAELLELQRQITQGIKALQQTKLGKKHGRSALYALPWYAIIGPPGCGKTTALRHSGLSFPFADPRGGGGIKGVGGTRNCDWWFTNEAILLDTAGRYATEDDDRDEWFGFLDLLKKYRPKKPLNGLLVAIAVSDLVQANEEQIAAYGAKLRARIDEIMSRLETVLPVYLVLTKTDLLGGFSEFFNELRKSERDQIFGATFPITGSPIADPGAAFTEQFDQLTSVLHARAVRIIGEERFPHNRPRILQFPLEFKALRANVEDLVRIVFAPNTFQESPLFRGFYLTSGTQEGRPIDRVIGGMARAFGLQVGEVGQEPREPKSYFVTDLFRRVVFPDQNIAGATELAIKRRVLTQALIAGGLMLFGALLAIPAVFTYANNRELSAHTAAVALAATRVPWAGGAPPVGEVPKLDALRDSVAQLASYEKDGAPLRLRWWMYTGDELYTPARDVFVSIHDKNLSQPVRERVRAQLSGMSQMGTLPPDEFRPNYDALKLYLMMGIPERLDEEWAAMRLGREWKALARAAEPAAAPMKANLSYYVGLVKRKEAPSWKLDEAVVTSSRAVLLRAPRLERLYEILVRDANQEVPPIRRQDVFYGAVAPFVTSKDEVVVEGAYTKEGWQRVRQLLGAQQSRLADEGWVLGQERDLVAGEMNKQIGELRDLYFTRYTQAWVDFLSDMEVRQPESAMVSLDELQALSEPVWPYQRLLRALNDNAVLDVEDDTPTLADGLVDKAKALAEKKLAEKKLIDAGAPPAKKTRKMSPVEKAFLPMLEFAIPPASDAKADAAPTGLSQYQQLLAKLVGVLTDLRDSEAGPDTSKLATEFEQAFRATSSLLTTQNGFTRPLLSPYLMRPITGAWSGVVKDAGGAASGLWETTVWEKWHASIEGHYPFTQSPKDVRLEDYVAFFQPEKGLLWAFYRDNLGGSLKRVGDSFRPTRRFQASASYTPDFVNNCLERGTQIVNATFPPNSPDPVVAFDINLHSVSPDVAEVHLEVDGASKIYKNTPEEWLSVVWPAKDAKSRGAKVRIRGYSGLDEQIVREGDFGLFRLIDAANKIEAGTAGGVPGAERTQVATWSLRSQGVEFKLDLRPVRANVAISSEVFRDYRCPRVIATAGN